MQDKEINICILNYNGANDTIDCIKSLKRYENNLGMRILVYDNKSSESDREALRKGLVALDETFSIIEVSGKNPDTLESEELSKCILFLGDENLGFAKANNWLVRYALQFKGDLFVLLNNDTVFIEPSLSRLIEEFTNTTKQCDYATTDIHYYSDPSESWNAGGSMHFGTRKYNHNKEIEAYLRRNEHFPKVDFITGCFLLFSRETVKKVGLLSEDFFFGEEDYEYALRARAVGAVGRVLLDTYILHKVSASIERGNSSKNVARSFIHHLNRMVDMRLHYNMAQWIAWSNIASLHYRKQLIENFGFTREEADNLIFNLKQMSRMLNGVDKDLFEQLISYENEKYKSKFSQEDFKKLCTQQGKLPGDVL